MSEVSYQQRRGQIENYFDRTAADAWATSTRGPSKRTC